MKIAAPFTVQKTSKPHKKAIVLFSGGLDSTTCLYWALSQGYTCETLTVTYGQRHAREIESAKKIAAKLGVKTHFLDITLPWLASGCSLTDASQALDFAGYPDCTPQFYTAAAQALNRGTKKGVTEGLEVLAPLMYLSKADIVRLAAQLNVPFELTWSCYAGGDKPCGTCDSCKLRARGFAQAGVKDTSLD